MAGRKSITSRWFVNSFSVVIAVLIIMDAVLFFVIKQSYYTAVSQYIQTEANIVSGVLTRFFEDAGTDYSAEIRMSVEEFEKKDHAELMAINRSGQVVISSSGFTPEDNYDMPDYKLALESRDGVGVYSGRQENGDGYMAVSVIIGTDESTYSAIRIITSLEKVDAQIMTITLGVGIISIAILLLLLMLGMYFVKSIAMPIKQVSQTARKLAQGDFSTRLQPKNDDEVGELCRVFNYMADELENSEQIKNEFISSVSHELRTPLTAIKGWSETILEIPNKETVQKGMKVISTETERLSAMVEELLDFSRMQNGGLTLQKTNMDILAEVADAVLIYTEKAKQDGLVINYNEPDDVVMIYGDKNRIRQVFINIIDNAIKYSREHGVINVDVDISAENVAISVQDGGCGISAEDLPKIKKRFYKANNTVRGSGIGLAVADEIVSMHGGTLDIKSEQGVGTTVTIKLPRIQKKAE